MDKKLLDLQIALVEASTLSELKDRFLMLYGFDCGQTNSNNLRKRIIYKIQEIGNGGLSEEDKKMIADLADQDPIANLKPNATEAKELVHGTRLQRDWKGKTYEVVIRGNGKYEYDGKIYNSLSAIADLITGTHWNGKKFFGVK